MKILIIGSEGMLGHVVKKYFEEANYEVYGTERATNSKYHFDVTEGMGNLNKYIDEIRPEVVINCIGLLNKVAEDNHSLAVLINSYFPHYMDELAIKKNFKFIHISTDCVFSGNDGKYDELSYPDARNFYGRSKALGEINNNHNLTIRTSIVGPDMNQNGIGLFQWFTKQIGEINGYTNVIWTGITTIECAKCMEYAIKNNFTGLIHAVNNDEISKYDLLNLFKKYYNKNIIINKNNDVMSRKTLIATRSDQSFIIPSYDEMIGEMNNWIQSHSELYEVGD